MKKRDLFLFAASLLLARVFSGQSVSAVDNFTITDFDVQMELDRAVDRLYRKEPFASDVERVAMLFEKYQKVVRG